jgi:hypothetical protein
MRIKRTIFFFACDGTTPHEVTVAVNSPQQPDIQDIVHKAEEAKARLQQRPARPPVEDDGDGDFGSVMQRGW